MSIEKINETKDWFDVHHTLNKYFRSSLSSILILLESNCKFYW